MFRCFFLMVALIAYRSLYSMQELREGKLFRSLPFIMKELKDKYSIRGFPIYTHNKHLVAACLTDETILFYDAREDATRILTEFDHAKYQEIDSLSYQNDRLEPGLNSLKFALGVTKRNTFIVWTLGDKGTRIAEMRPGLKLNYEQ